LCFWRWNQFAPFVEPAPGMNFTTTVGLPGSASLSSGAKKLAHLAEPPVSENGITHWTVLPDMSADADIGRAAARAVPMPAARCRRERLFKDMRILLLRGLSW